MEMYLCRQEMREYLSYVLDPILFGGLQYSYRRHED